MPDYVIHVAFFDRSLQYVAYFALFFFLSGLVAALYTYFEVVKRKTLALKEKIAAISVFAFIVCFLAIFISLFLPIMSVYLFFIVFILLDLMILIIKGKKGTVGVDAKKAIKTIVLLTLFLSIPFVAGAAMFYVGMTNAQSIQSEEDKVVFSSEYSLNHTFSVWNVTGYSLFRSNNDLSGFFVLGYSACGELAFIESTMLNWIGMDARLVFFPGENHELVEVKVNGIWMASDPGYGQYKLASTEARGEGRIAEFGALSIVYALNSDSSMEMRTTAYNPTYDNITLQVFESGIFLKFLNSTSPEKVDVELVEITTPYAYGSITLHHIFQGNDFTLPEMALDWNGSISFNLGNMQNYTSSETDDHYRVYVNGNYTGLDVTSYGKLENSYYSTIIRSNNIFLFNP